jgi:hypothetical protein
MLVFFWISFSSCTSVCCEREWKMKCWCLLLFLCLMSSYTVYIFIGWNTSYEFFCADSEYSYMMCSVYWCFRVCSSSYIKQLCFNPFLQQFQKSVDGACGFYLRKFLQAASWLNEMQECNRSTTVQSCNLENFFCWRLLHYISCE